MVYEDQDARLIEVESHDIQFFEFQYLEKNKTRVTIELFEQEENSLPEKNANTNGEIK